MGSLSHYPSDQFKVKVTGITISEKQRVSTAECVKRNPNVTIIRQDYRNV